MSSASEQSPPSGLRHRLHEIIFEIMGAVMYLVEGEKNGFDSIPEACIGRSSP